MWAFLNWVNIIIRCPEVMISANFADSSPLPRSLVNRESMEVLCMNIDLRTNTHYGEVWKVRYSEKLSADVNVKY